MLRQHSEGSRGSQQEPQTTQQEAEPAQVSLHGTAIPHPFRARQACARQQSRSTCSGKTVSAAGGHSKNAKPHSKKQNPLRCQVSRRTEQQLPLHSVRGRNARARRCRVSNHVAHGQGRQRRQQGRANRTSRERESFIRLARSGKQGRCGGLW
eukprot:2568643-Rhodomonas_salina.1